MVKKVLVTGAGGFIGGFIVEEALRRGYEVWAAVRATTSREYLADSRIRFITLDFSNRSELEYTLRKAVEENGRWDYVVHNLGATKCRRPEDFERVNVGCLRALTESLLHIEAVPDGFLMMSSMSVLGCGDETGYRPFTASSATAPVTAYGRSKLMAERYLQSLPEFPYVAFRPTGVYGPRERDYFLMIKSIACGFDFGVGYRRQLLTFIYVKDLACAIFDALESGVRRKSYLLADGKTYTQKDFREIVKRELGKRFVVPIVAPLWIVKIVCAASEWLAGLRGKVSTLNRDKYLILKQRNWACDTSEATADFGFHANYDLQAGLREAIAWYRSNHWLKK